MEEKVKISFILNSEARKKHGSDSRTQTFSQSAAWRVRRFHRSFPQYEPTPLVKLTGLARALGVADVRIKDESLRFGLNAFKVLGASHATASVVAEERGINVDDLSFDLLRSVDVKKKLGAITFVTATDGNHGRAVAWAARELGCTAVVYMPKGSSSARFEAIKDLGATTTIIDGNFDDAVHLAAQQAQRYGWILLQDTAWEDYEKIPIRIMQGYLTILNEALEQLEGIIPTHVFVQCGVGSLAGALQAHLFELFGAKRPRFAVVEADRAACFYKSMVMGNEKPQKVSGDLDTIMAGLACGEPSALAWNILRRYADVFVACNDPVAIKGMRALGRPLPGDPRVISGESGAVTAGLLACILEPGPHNEIAAALDINQNSTILLISTEGDTDPAMYQKIMFDINQNESM
ncbi:MAG: diaminopropionate ammonia-lyase [Desulfobacteraceae bacterium]|nr:MAG: diaminopropionate ammonia-lyase [Desulfobacteraceae bacterium]